MKVSNILSAFDEFEVYSLNDKNELIKKYFTEHVVKNIDISASQRNIHNTVLGISHAIYFWDGTELDQYIYYSLLEKNDVRIIPIKTTRVANKDRGDKYEVYIGRGTPWGNPFAIGDNGMSREEVIEEYKKYFSSHFLEDANKLKELMSLKGKVLGCHCKPQLCHGDIIEKYLNSVEYNI